MPYTLLLADDSVTIQRVIELTFADEDVQVIAVSDGDQAIQHIDASPPDIVLADIGMPGKNGYEVAQHVKRSPRLAHIPVVLLTGAFEPVDQARMLAAGCDGVLAKPFEPHLVIDRVKSLLSTPRRPAPPSVAATLGSPDPPPKAPVLADLDTYFDRLDAAFSDMNAAPDLSKAAPVSPATIPDDIDWFGTDASARAIEPAWTPRRPAERVAMSQMPPAAVAETASPTPPAGEVPSPPAGAAPPSPSPPPLPSLADAFAALLAAEQGEPAPGLALSWPASNGSNGNVPDDVVEQIARRVLDRLSDRVVRETVGEIVSSIAERLVREEIERIKSSIK